MSLRQILRTLLRRWYLVLLGLLLSGALGYAGYALAPPVYEARGTILLLPSKDQMATGGRNPFLQLNNLDSISGIVIARLNGDDAINAFEDTHPTAEYVVQPDLTMRGPTIQVIATDETEEGSLNVLNLLLDDATRTLLDVQTEQKVPKPAIVGSMRLVVDSTAEKQTDATVRTAIAAGVAGLLASGILVFAIDGLLLRRRHNQENRGSQPGRAQPRGRRGAGKNLDDEPDNTLQPELPEEIDAAEPAPQPAPAKPRTRVSRPRRVGKPATEPKPDAAAAAEPQPAEPAKDPAETEEPTPGTPKDGGSDAKSSQPSGPEASDPDATTADEKLASTDTTWRS